MLFVVVVVVVVVVVAYLPQASSDVLLIHRNRLVLEMRMLHTERGVGHTQKHKLQYTDTISTMHSCYYHCDSYHKELSCSQGTRSR